MRIRIGRHGAVDCSATLRVPLPAVAVWGQLRDFPRYAQQDFFHAEMCIEGGIARQGAALTMRHRFAGFTVCRVGRICQWREGERFSFSDLSTRGPRSGFPHVFSCRVRPVADSATDVDIRVRGKWTARVPRLLARLWLAWVFGHIVRQTEQQLLLYCIWRKRNYKPATNGPTHSRRPPASPEPVSSRR